MEPVIIKTIQEAPANVKYCPCLNIAGTITDSPLISSKPAINLIMPGLKSSAHVPPPPAKAYIKETGTLTRTDPRRPAKMPHSKAGCLRQNNFTGIPMTN